MQVPLLHRYTQMALLKKQVRRKAKELRLRRRRARRRLEVMRRIRDHLLRRMRNLIEVRQRDAELERREQARRAVGGMLAMYKSWLRNWSKALRLQGRLIRHQELLKKRLHRRLHQLRKQLKKRRHPQQLVDNSFHKLEKAVKKWQNSSNYHKFIEGQDEIWDAEANEVRKFLSDIRSRRSRKIRRVKVSQDEDLEDFAHFWMTEVQRKSEKIKKRLASEKPKGDLELEELSPTRKPLMKKEKSKPNSIYLSIDELVIQKKVKKLGKKRKAVRKQRELDPTKPSFDELKILVKELIRFDKRKKERHKKHKHRVPRKPKGTVKAIVIKDRHKGMREELGLSDISMISDPQLPKKVIRKKPRKVVHPKLKKLDPVIVPEPKILKSEVLGSKKRGKFKNKFKKHKTKFVDMVIKDELRALLQEKKTKIDFRRGRQTLAASGTLQHKKTPFMKPKNIVSRLFNDLPLFMRHQIRKKKFGHHPKGYYSSSTSSTYFEEVDPNSDSGKSAVAGKQRKGHKLHADSSGSKINVIVDLTLHQESDEKNVSFGKHKQKSNQRNVIGPAPRLSEDGDLFGKLKHRPKLTEKSGSQIEFATDSVISLSDSINKIITANRPRRSVRRSIRTPLTLPKKLRVAPPKGQEESHYQSLKKDIMYIRASDEESAQQRKSKRYSNRLSASDPGVNSRRQSKRFLPKSVSDSNLSELRPKSRNIIGDYNRDNNQTTGGDQPHIQIGETRIKSATQSRDPQSTRSPTKDKPRQPFEFNYEALPDDLEKFFDPLRDQTYTYDRHDKTPDGHYLAGLLNPSHGRFAMKDLISDAKYKPLQRLLKAVIENNHIIEFVADVKGLMEAVGQHPMWAHLQNLHSELMESGVSLDEAKQMLTTKYLDFLKGIVSEMHLPRIQPPRDSLLNVVEGEPAKSKPASQVDRLLERNLWNRQRLSTRLIPFGMRGLRGNRSATPHSRRQSQDARMNSVLYKKLIEQEMNAERLEREERKRLTYGSFGSSMSINTSLELAPNEEQEVRDIEMRYSLVNIKSIVHDHNLMFKAMERKGTTAKLVHKEMEGKLEKMISTARFRRPKEKFSTSTTHKRRRNPRPIEQLYYSPRKTCRLQKISDSSGCSGCESGESGIGDSMVLEKCPRCGVKVPVPAPISSFPQSASSSREILSSGSIEACAKHELIIKSLADLCTRCGWVHERGHPCSQLPFNTRKCKLLKRIKDTIRTAQDCPAFCSPRGILKNPRS
ncbi:uncharacterized protein LOC108029800 [Drosophila biarmipes]|uniref:uncharacterized protein LOC108029800 n=1 Tax=Drosophila biarmipes TaxID=125945 RepID=UPI0007E754AD|nr:uncharacterized protein LOC108029800 [Drosophila biarmipes]